MFTHLVMIFYSQTRIVTHLFNLQKLALIAMTKITYRDVSNIDFLSFIENIVISWRIISP